MGKAIYSATTPEHSATAQTYGFTDFYRTMVIDMYIATHLNFNP